MYLLTPSVTRCASAQQHARLQAFIIGNWRRRTNYVLLHSGGSVAYTHGISCHPGRSRRAPASVSVPSSPLNTNKDRRSGNMKKDSFAHKEGQTVGGLQTDTFGHKEGQTVRRFQKDSHAIKRPCRRRSCTRHPSLRQWQQRGPRVGNTQLQPAAQPMGASRYVCRCLALLCGSRDVGILLDRSTTEHRPVGGKQQLQPATTSVACHRRPHVQALGVSEPSPSHCHRLAHA